MRTLPFLLTAVAALGQAPRLEPPVLGYIFDTGSQSLRAVNGVPGAAGVDLGVSFDEALSTAFVSPSSEFAVTIGKSGRVSLARLNGRVLAGTTPLNPAFGQPSRVAFGGSDRVLLVSAGGAELVAGLRTETQSAWSYAASVLGGQPVRAALSSDGTLAAVVLDSGKILEISAEGPRMVATGVGAIYMPGTHDLLIQTLDHTLTVRASEGGASLIDVDADSELAAVSGCGRAFLLNYRSGRIRVVDLSTGESVNLGGLKPVAAHALAVDGVFYVEDEDGGGLLLNTGPAMPELSKLPGVDARRAQ